MYVDAVKVRSRVGGSLPVFEAAAGGGGGQARSRGGFEGLEKIYLSDPF